MANNRPTGLPVITGIPKVGQSLVAAAGSLADADGLGAITWKWQSSRIGKTWVDIPGATGSSYIPTRIDYGGLLRAVATYTDNGGNLESMASAPSAPVLMDNSPAQGAPTISGDRQVGGVLTASTAAISDPDGLPLRFNVQWERALPGSGVFTPIPEATGSRYQVRNGDQGFRLRVTVSYTDKAGFAESLPSLPLDAVPFLNRVGTGAPLISGVAKVGQNLTASQGTLLDADGLGPVQFQWQAAPLRRSTNGPGTFVDIPAANQPIYRLSPEDRGLFVRVVASYIDQAGFVEGPHASLPTPLVTQDNNLATGTPAILGDAFVGQTVTASIGSIGDSDGIGTVTYRWQVKNPDTQEFKSVPGGSSLQLPERYFGQPLRLEASFTDGAGFKEILYSIPTAPIGKINRLPSGSPQITGIPQVGRLLKVDRGTLADSNGISARSIFYTWEAFDPTSQTYSVIDKSGRTSYRVSANDEGQQIRVTASYKDRSGFSESASSLNTAVIAPPTLVLQPKLASGNIDGDLIRLFFNTELAQTNPSAALFRITAGKTVLPVVNVSIDGLNGLVALKLAQPVSSNDIVRVTYRDLKGDQQGSVIESRSGVDAGRIIGYTVDNIARDQIAPTVNQRTVNGNRITLSINEEIDAAAPDPLAFEAFVNGVLTAITNVNVKPDIAQVILQLEKSVRRGDSVELSYKDLINDQSGKVIQDAAGNDLPSFSRQPVVNETEDSTPLRPDFIEVIDDLLTIYFERDIDSTLPPLTAFRIEVNGLRREITQIRVDVEARLADITLAEPVAAGDVVTLTHTDLLNDQATGVLQDSVGNDLANLLQSPVLNSTLDRDTLTLERVGVEGARLDLFFNKPLQDSIPAIARFSLTTEDSIDLSILRIETNPSDGHVIVLLDRAIDRQKDILLSYRDLSGDQDSGVIQDLNGVDLTNLTSINLSNYISTAPAARREAPLAFAVPPQALQQRASAAGDALINPTASGLQQQRDGAESPPLQALACSLHDQVMPPPMQIAGPLAALPEPQVMPDWRSVSPWSHAALACSSDGLL